MRLEYRTLKVLPPIFMTMIAHSASLTKTDGKIDDGKAFGDDTKTIHNNHCLVDKTVTMCGSYFTKTY